MFQRKIGIIFKEVPNVFGITADKIIVGCDGDFTDHYATLGRVLKICKKDN